MSFPLIPPYEMQLTELREYRIHTIKSDLRRLKESTRICTKDSMEITIGYKIVKPTLQNTFDHLIKLLKEAEETKEFTTQDRISFLEHCVKRNRFCDKTKSDHYTKAKPYLKAGNIKKFNEIYESGRFLEHAVMDTKHNTKQCRCYRWSK